MRTHAVAVLATLFVARARLSATLAPWAAMASLWAAPVTVPAAWVTAPVTRPARRALRALGLVNRDARIPRWLRRVLWVACLPIPGPVDNAAQIAVGLVLLVAYRPVLIDAWRAAGA